MFMDFVGDFSACHPERRHAALFWLGQAGFLLKTASGRTIAIDPYFSDSVARCENTIGYKRLMPALCGAGDIAFDAVLISHEHGDHFDVDSIAAMMDHPGTQVYTNGTVAELIARMGLDSSRVHVLQRGQRVALADGTLTATDCDHGSSSPEALGFLIDLDFVRIYYAGDTALTLDRLQYPISVQPEVAILPINGAFGNLNGYEAAHYAGLLGAKRVIPCHFWTFALHHGDPQEIIDALPKFAPGCALSLLCQGEVLML